MKVLLELSARRSAGKMFTRKQTEAPSSWRKSESKANSSNITCERRSVNQLEVIQIGNNLKSLCKNVTPGGTRMKSAQPRAAL